MSLWGRYTRLLETNPLATKAVTSGVLSCVGDVAAQVPLRHLVGGGKIHSDFFFPTK